MPADWAPVRPQPSRESADRHHPDADTAHVRVLDLTGRSASFRSRDAGAPAEAGPTRSVRPATILRLGPSAALPAALTAQPPFPAVARHAAGTRATDRAEAGGGAAEAAANDYDEGRRPGLPCTLCAPPSARFFFQGVPSDLARAARRPCLRGGAPAPPLAPPSAAPSLAAPAAARRDSHCSGLSLSPCPGRLPSRTATSVTPMPAAIVSREDGATAPSAMCSPISSAIATHEIRINVCRLPDHRQRQRRPSAKILV